jgi:hypothetical protein
VAYGRNCLKCIDGLQQSKGLGDSVDVFSQINQQKVKTVSVTVDLYGHGFLDLSRINFCTPFKCLDITEAPSYDCAMHFSMSKPHVFRKVTSSADKVDASIFFSRINPRNRSRMTRRHYRCDTNADRHIISVQLLSRASSTMHENTPCAYGTVCLALSLPVRVISFFIRL